MSGVAIWNFGLWQLVWGKPLFVYSADAPPLYIGGIEAEGEADNDKKELIRLSFHRRCYALEEHFNLVVTVEEE